MYDAHKSIFVRIVNPVLREVLSKYKDLGMFDLIRCPVSEEVGEIDYRRHLLIDELHDSEIVDFELRETVFDSMEMVRTFPRNIEDVLPFIVLLLSEFIETSADLFHRFRDEIVNFQSEIDVSYKRMLCEYRYNSNDSSSFSFYESSDVTKMRLELVDKYFVFDNTSRKVSRYSDGYEDSILDMDAARLKNIEYFEHDQKSHPSDPPNFGIWHESKNESVALEREYANLVSFNYERLAMIGGEEALLENLDYFALFPGILIRLKRGGVRTFGQLKACSETDLMHMRNVNIKIVEALRDFLDGYGIVLQ